MNCPICNIEIIMAGKSYYNCELVNSLPTNNLLGHYYKDNDKVIITSKKYQICYFGNRSDFYIIKNQQGLKIWNLSFSINSSFKIIKKSVDETYNHYYKLRIFS